ncbi:conserved exported hypothetical protein [Flavobacterium sp. 9AF]|uniref:hypothetical protein n=1 Tax=Flavobacterium sp. 9AF TaxID=2653142 RepID=UPI0012EFA0B6|nr:hypothetical protein [Flavobacterium sp. 9AF]VXA95178.1 conserved exported hypothetical protein [Flavobacterium sp. 9AF]
MKKIFTLITLILTFIGFAQTPQKMSYQAVVRDASDALITSTTVGMQISILQGSASGTAVYMETHTPTTNANGLVSVEIGSGSVVSGNLSTIDWSTGNYYIKSETDVAGGTNYTISGTSQLLSVPYALYAGKAAGTLSNGVTAGNTPYWNGTTWVTNGNNFYNNGANIGIGTTNPTSAKLVINGGSAGQQGLDLATHDSYANMRVIQNTNSLIDKDLYLGYNSGNTSKLHLYSANNETVTVSNNMVGLNNNNPQARLDVNGNVKIVDGTQGAGKVLTSDANGVASWANPVATAPYYSFVTGNNQQMTFPVGDTSAMLMVSLKENCIASKGAVATIYYDATSNTVNILNTSANATLVTTSANVMQLNNGCVPMTFTFSINNGILTIAVGGDPGGVITSKWIVLGV